jgi:hypothetical protein
MLSRNLALITVSSVIGCSLVIASGPPAEHFKADESWAFHTPRKEPVPSVQGKAWVRNPVDAFILARLEANNLAPSESADKLTLLRRATFDLTGLAPTLAEQEMFLADQSPDAYERVVNRLLASAHYGERWAQYWLDLVRYAETDGFKADDFRPNAHKYRDYVIKSLNNDIPYDRFIRQQLAGDELEPDNPEALIATGLNRLWPSEYNAANLEQRRQEILDDVTDVTGSVFLGLTIGCARCHDHKFDPISQADYYRFQALFAAMQPRDDLVAADAEQKREYALQLAAWEAATRDLRGELASLTADKRAELRQHALTKFRPEIQEAVKTPLSERTPYQQQIAGLAEDQIHKAEKDVLRKLPADKRERCRQLELQMTRTEVKQPAPPSVTMAITDVGRKAPPTYVLATGDWRKPRKEVQPGFPAVLGKALPDTRLTADLPTTGRRAALARWLTRPDHPLTARVIVNRVWQHHFGVGIVATPSDFGGQGDKPTHPELLDWLAVELVESGWSLKHVHRLMMTSATYRQTSLVNRADPRHFEALAKDRPNKLLWHASRRRLEGETLRDAMLALSGELNARPFGPGARPLLPDKVSSYAWSPDLDPVQQNRRSIYVFAKRNMRYPLFDSFDLPDMHNSCACRAKTTTAPQALLLMNGEFSLQRAKHWSVELLAAYPKDERALVAQAYRSAWGRPGTEEEIEAALRFLRTQGETIRNREPGPATSASAAPTAASDPYRAAAIADFCHAVLNANEFLYVD